MTVLMDDLKRQLPQALAALREKSFNEGQFELTGCTSYIQRKLQCGYNRAATILDLLVEQKQITEPDDRGARTLARFNPN